MAKPRTQPEKVNAFFTGLTRDRLRDGEEFVTVLEVCGFNDWLIEMLRNYRCHKVILIQPEGRSKRKTDQRDAAALSELLWVNRGRRLEGKPVRGLRQVDITIMCGCPEAMDLLATGAKEGTAADR